MGIFFLSKIIIPLIFLEDLYCFYNEDQMKDNMLICTSTKHKVNNVDCSLVDFISQICKC